MMRRKVAKEGIKSSLGTHDLGLILPQILVCVCPLWVLGRIRLLCTKRTPTIKAPPFPVEF